MTRRSPFLAPVLTLLLFAGCGPEADSNARPDDSTTAVTSALSTDSDERDVKQGQTLAYEGIAIEPGTRVEVSTSGNGDVDLFVSFVEHPSSSQFACRSGWAGSTEHCTVDAPSTATAFYVQIYGYRSSHYKVSVKYTEPKPNQPMLNFSYFAPASIVTYRDGGTIVVSGELNRSYHADIRLDGALGSPTQGQFFVTLKEMWKTAEPERGLQPWEYDQLVVAMNAFIQANPKADPAYATFQSALERAANAR